ncbi:hypothetical protein ACQBAT_03845 [Ornithinimicrobium sp. Y1847]|uniref:hypothetical protein n=1 Tax=unclassified Ornithinimicrobium TaxID=2615080 RepID=UPI003B6771B8
MSTASDTAPDLVARGDSLWRFQLTLAGAVLSVLGVLLLVVGRWGWALGVGLIVLFCFSERRRRIEVRDGVLTAQGRISRRELRIADLTQVAIGPISMVWVSTNDGQSLWLRQVSVHNEGEHLGHRDFAARLRELAIDAGARLEDAPPEGTTPPLGTPLLFSL